jgi:predicted DNA-binding transcriptional regulator AlpA
MQRTPTTQAQPRQLMSAKQVQARLAISRFALYRLVEKGRLSTVKLTGPNASHFFADEVEALVREATRPGKNAPRVR